MNRTWVIVLLGVAVCVSAQAVPPGGDGRILFYATSLPGGYRECLWGDSRYGGLTTYRYDVAGGRFRVWYVLEGPNAVQDKTDNNANGVPDVIEKIGADFETAFAFFTDKKWYYHPDPDEQKYLPLRDRYAGLHWPPDGSDYGGDDRWDIYCGSMSSGTLGAVYVDQQFWATTRECYSFYFNVPNVYNRSQAPREAMNLWTAGTDDMFDAAETSATAETHWLALATELWADELGYPQGPPGATYFNSYFSNTRLPFVTTAPATYLFFLQDWGKHYWLPPQWRSRADEWTVRDVWRAGSRGDGWYTGETTLDRNAEEAVSYVVEYNNLEHAYVDGRAFPDAFELFTTWNWFTGSRDDGRHYEYGSQYPTLVPHNTWTTYPVENYEPSTGARLSYLGAGYYRFDSLPNWTAAVLTFQGDAANAAATKDWGGHVTVTTNGTTWTDLAGNAGAMTPLVTPGDKGIIQLRSPGSYASALMVLDCAAYVGADLKFNYSFLQTDDVTPPGVATAIVRPEGNLAALEVLVGGDETLFGVEADVLFTPDDNSPPTRRALELYAAPGGYNFLGTYDLAVGQSGDGQVTWRTADMAGNVVAGTKDFSAGWLAGGGGSVGGERARLTLLPGAVGQLTLFTLAPTYKEAGNAEGAAAAAGTTTMETVGPAYEVGPAWVHLARPAEVALSYETLRVTDEDRLTVFQWKAGAWEDLGRTLDRRNRRVVAVADRLGTFILGYGAQRGTPPPAGKPMAFGLYQNFPNPARGETTVKFALPAAASVELALYDLAGRKIATAFAGRKEAGVHAVRVRLVNGEGRRLPAGVYYYRLAAGNDVATRKMVVSR